MKHAGNLSFYILVASYLLAGYNHFANPGFYEPLIPPYLSAWATQINTLAGIAEIAGALLLIPRKTRKAASIGIIIMLICFIPSHIWFIQKGSFSLGPFTMTPFIAWTRLLLVHPLLIAWAWWGGHHGAQRNDA
jgi:uncharacterized membrane protein